MKLLFVADRWERIHATSDTTLAILRTALKRKHKVFWTTGDAVRLEDGRVRARVIPCLTCAEDRLPDTGAEEDRAVVEFDALWIRKDPPFDDSYVSLCWLLCVEENRVLMLNRPSLLLRYHEKMIPFEALAQGFLKPGDLIPTHIGDAASARAYLERGGFETAIRKPFFGFGGGKILKFAPQAGEFPAPDELELTQPFQKEVMALGDRRLFYLRGKFLGDFVRMPKSGGFVSNLAQGGSASIAPLTVAQRAVVDRLGKFLRKSGIVFAGADLIGRHISEVNITSPTGLRSFAKLTGKDLSEKLIDYAEAEAK